MSLINRAQILLNAARRLGESVGSISDGYHTFDELYEHRIALFIKLCELKADNDSLYGGGGDLVWKSKLHSDGTSYEGWFIAGIGTKPGEQISYHLPLKYWDALHLSKELEKAPEWDGHTSADVLKRLSEL